MTEVDPILKIVWSIFGTLGVALLGLIVWGIKKWITTTFENTVALKVLSEKLDNFSKQIETLPKIQRDVSAAHEKIRKIEKGTI